MNTKATIEKNGGRYWTFQLKDTMGNLRYCYRHAKGVELVGKNETPLCLSTISENGALLRTRLLRCNQESDALKALREGAEYAKEITAI